MGVPKFKKKVELNYRRGYTSRSCNNCNHLVAYKRVGEHADDPAISILTADSYLSDNGRIVKSRGDVVGTRYHTICDDIQKPVNHLLSGKGYGMIAWPKGKYNGCRIEGFKVCVAVHVLSWRLLPLLTWNFGEPVFIWLCFTVRAKCEYEYRSR